MVGLYRYKADLFRYPSFTVLLQDDVHDSDCESTAGGRRVLHRHCMAYSQDL